jgi:predicted TIM-barrel fold metal-dependent hydrolase
MSAPLVADAVVHPYDLSDANRLPAATAQLDAVYAAHAWCTRPDQAAYRLTEQEFFTDFPFEAVARSLFVESDVDLAILHALPCLGFTHGPVTDPFRAAAARDAHPDRFLLYATVDTPVTADAIAQLEAQVAHGVDGLKLYPSFFYDGGARGWRLDDPDVATPLLEAARDMGIRNVAVHKALWLPPAPRSAFAVDDLAGPLERFGDLSFFMIHAGTAFVEETATLLERHPNFHATLESTFAYICVRPRQFAEVLARLLRAAGPERLLYGSGSNLMHPRPLLEAFAAYELPEDLLGDDLPQLDEAARAAILGGNALRLHGIDADERLARLADDAYARARAAGPVEPWSALRDPAAAQDG